MKIKTKKLLFSLAILLAAVLVTILMLPISSTMIDNTGAMNPQQSTLNYDFAGFKFSIPIGYPEVNGTTVHVLPIAVFVFTYQLIVIPFAWIGAVISIVFLFKYWKPKSKQK